MITIKITNAQQLILEKKGWFVANVVGAVLDLEVKVETIVAERVRASLASDGAEARLSTSLSPRARVRVRPSVPCDGQDFVHASCTEAAPNLCRMPRAS